MTEDPKETDAERLQREGFTVSPSVIEGCSNVDIIASDPGEDAEAYWNRAQAFYADVRHLTPVEYDALLPLARQMFDSISDLDPDDLATL